MVCLYPSALHCRLCFRWALFVIPSKQDSIFLRNNIKPHLLFLALSPFFHSFPDIFRIPSLQSMMLKFHIFAPYRVRIFSPSLQTKTILTFKAFQRCFFQYQTISQDLSVWNAEYFYSPICSFRVPLRYSSTIVLELRRFGKSLLSLCSLQTVKQTLKNWDSSNTRIQWQYDCDFHNKAVKIQGLYSSQIYFLFLNTLSLIVEHI